MSTTSSKITVPEDGLPLPEAGDCLFEQGKLSIAPIEYDERYRFYDMKHGYKLAGDVLVRYCLTDGASPFDGRLMFPILYCYRHFLELSMKWILWHREEYRSMSVYKSHDLGKLFDHCRLIFKDLGFDDDPGVSASQNMILQMHERDRGSFNFRYTHDTVGNPIDLGIGVVDLIRLRAGIEKLHSFFDITESIIHAELDARSDSLSWGF
jgi:hypothetical protein